MPRIPHSLADVLLPHCLTVSFCCLPPPRPLQATRNGNDLWLSRWVAHTPPAAAPPAAAPQWRQWELQGVGNGLKGAAEPAAAACWCTQSMQPGVPLPACAPSACASIWCSGGRGAAPAAVASSPAPAAAGLLGGAGSQPRHARSGDRGSGKSGGGGRQPLDPTVRFYLTGLLVIAGANSVITLVRAFSFAKGGLVAAQASTGGCGVCCGAQLADGWAGCASGDGSCAGCCVAPVWLAPHPASPKPAITLQRVHEQLLDAVLALPLAFFDATPPGRILNRFSSDTGAVRGLAGRPLGAALLAAALPPMPTCLPCLSFTARTHA